MADRKATTIDLQGQDYARVPERIKLFREDCPNGKIITQHQEEEGELTFKSYVWKDKADVKYDMAGDVILNSADSTGTARQETNQSGKVKQFEKLETVSVGRALALLGYLASGEIASSEEMEEFVKYQEVEMTKKINKTVDAMKKAKSLSELARIFLGSGLATNDEVIKVKEDMKVKLYEKSKTAKAKEEKATE